MKRRAILGREDLWCVIKWSDTNYLDVVKGNEVSCDSFKVNSSVKVKYKNSFYVALIVEIVNSKEEAKLRVQDIERQTYTGDGKKRYVTNYQDKTGTRPETEITCTGDPQLPLSGECSSLDDTTRDTVSAVEAQSKLMVPDVFEAGPSKGPSTSGVNNLLQTRYKDDSSSSSDNLPELEYSSSSCEITDQFETTSDSFSSDGETPKRKKKFIKRTKGKRNKNVKVKKAKIKNNQKEDVSSSEFECSDPEKLGDELKIKEKKINIREDRKIKRQKGEPYFNTRNFPVPGKSLKPNPCRSCKLRCGEITDEVRQELFSIYYSLSDQQQKDWLCSHCTKVPVSRRTTQGDSSRNFSYKYCIPYVDNGERYVCRQFILATLAINKKRLQYTLSKCTSLKTAKLDARGKAPSAKKTPEQQINEIKDFLKSLPIVPSHYNRANSTKKYLPSGLNRRILYDEYKRTLAAKGNPSFVSLQVFKKEFRKYNIGFHKPKKDKCVICEQMRNQKKSAGLTDEDKLKWKTHRKEKRATYREYKIDIEKSKLNDNLIVASFDLERVLATPHSDSTLMYYARKYAYYNLTIYENKTQTGTCYLWGECDGKKGAVEIATCVRLWLEDINQTENEVDVILYCDNCPGQNKNRCMFGMLYHAAQTLHSVRSITIKFLLSGHTYMGADTVHSTIASFIKRRNVLAPSQWPTVIALSRRNPKPFNCRKLEYSDFQNWNVLQELFPLNSSTNSGSKVKWMQLYGLKFIKNSKQVTIWNSNVTAQEETLEILKRRKIHFTEIEIGKAYGQRLPITEAKYKDLITLCNKGVIPMEFHDEYKTIPHSANVRDCLPETDIEDEDE